MNRKIFILNKLLEIPKGKVTTYKHLALACNEKSPRFVGSVMASNTELEKYPCYKVVGSDGSLTGYSGKGGLISKFLKLQRDGVKFKSNKKVDLIESLYTFDKI